MVSLTHRLLLYLKHRVHLYPNIVLRVFCLQVHYYVQSHIQINEYRDRVILVGFNRWSVLIFIVA
jgi:hypothetical protein